VSTQPENSIYTPNVVNRRIDHIFTERNGVAVTLYTQIRELLGSNLGWAQAIVTVVFRGFLPFLHASAGAVPQVDNAAYFVITHPTIRRYAIY
jgi:hypothetical protein